MTQCSGLEALQGPKQGAFRVFLAKVRQWCPSLPFVGWEAKIDYRKKGALVLSSQIRRTQLPSRWFPHVPKRIPKVDARILFAPLPSVLKISSLRWITCTLLVDLMVSRRSGLCLTSACNLREKRGIHERHSYIFLPYVFFFTTRGTQW